jgi:hypothetical protein
MLIVLSITTLILRLLPYSLGLAKIAYDFMNRIIMSIQLKTMALKFKITIRYINNITPPVIPIFLSTDSSMSEGDEMIENRFRAGDEAVRSSREDRAVAAGALGGRMRLLRRILWSPFLHQAQRRVRFRLP